MSEKNPTYVSTTNACKLCMPLGACLAFKGIEGCVPFLHGSQGCATYMRRYLISHYREPVDIASSSPPTPWAWPSWRACAGAASRARPSSCRPSSPAASTSWGVSVDLQRLMVVVLGALLVGGLWMFVNHTRLGLALKGMAQDERAALTLGIDSNRMAVVSMALGSAFAGAAALVLLPLGNIVVEAGYNVLIMAVAVCIVGGLGSWTGAILAAFIIGFAQILTVVLLGPHYQVVVALLAIIFTLIWRPSGLFGRQKELEERV